MYCSCYLSNQTDDEKFICRYRVIDIFYYILLYDDDRCGCYIYNLLYPLRHYLCATFFFLVFGVNEVDWSQAWTKFLLHHLVGIAKSSSSSTSTYNCAIIVGSNVKSISLCLHNQPNRMPSIIYLQFYYYSEWIGRSKKKTNKQA